MASKEELKKALNDLAEMSCIRSYTSNESYKILSQFINEKFELIEKYMVQDPYKFEDLKIGMWVYDILNDDCRQIAKINEYGGIYWYGSLTEYEADNFEENRFYPVWYANVEEFSNE